MRKAKIAIWAWTLLGVCAALGQAQTTGQSGKYCCEGYAFFGRRTSTPSTNVGGVGGDIFIYRERRLRPLQVEGVHFRDSGLVGSENRIIGALLCERGSPASGPIT